MKGLFKCLNFKKRNVREELKLQRAYKVVFSSPEGKTVLIDLMRESKMFSNNYSQELSLESLEGKRTIMYYILHILYKDVAKTTEEEYNKFVFNELNNLKDDE